MCVIRRSFNFEEEEEWLVYDPSLTAPTYTAFDTLVDAKTYCEVTVKLCGS